MGARGSEQIGRVIREDTEKKRKQPEGGAQQWRTKKREKNIENTASSMLVCAGGTAPTLPCLSISTDFDGLFFAGHFCWTHGSCQSEKPDDSPNRTPSIFFFNIPRGGRTQASVTWTAQYHCLESSMSSSGVITGGNVYVNNY